MELNIEVADVKLTDYIGDDDGDGITLADLIAEKIVHRLASTDEYRAIRGRVGEIRDDEIRKAVGPAIAEALTAPIRRTNTWGETYGTETTLREYVVAVAKELVSKPADNYNRGKGTVIEIEVRKQVEAAFKAEIAAEVKAAREAVTAELGTTVAELVADAVRTGLRAR